MAGESTSGYSELRLSLRRIGELYELELEDRHPGTESEFTPLRIPASLDPEILLAQQSDATRYGEVLTQQVFADPKAKERFVEVEALAQQHLGLRVIVNIHPEEEQLHGLRWELLRHPRTAVSLGTSERVLLSRFSYSQDRIPRLRARGRLVSLIAISAPPGAELLAPVDFEGEVGRAQAALAPISDTRVLGGPDDPCTLDRLVEELRDGVDILYLVSHGSFSTRTNTAALVLQTSEGTADYVTGPRLFERLSQLSQYPRLAVLASCESAGAHGAGAQASLAGRFSDGGVDAVVAMQGLVSIATVERMMPVFFDELARDGQIDRAMAVARAKVRDRHDAWMPLLSSRMRDGRLWSVTEPADMGTTLRSLEPFVDAHEADFQARVAAFIATHIVVGISLPTWANIALVPQALTCQTGSAGNEIWVETTARTTLDIQVKHGLDADARLQETIERFAQRLAPSDIGIIAVDEESSSNSVRSTLRKALDAWRQGQEPDVPTELRSRIQSLYEGRGKTIRHRIAIGTVHLDDDHAHGVGHAEALLRNQLMDRDLASSAWSILAQDAQYAAKRGARRDRGYYRQILSNKGVELVPEEQAVLSTPGLKAKPGLAANLPPVPPLLQAASDLTKAHRPAEALAVLDHYSDPHTAKYHLARGAALFGLNRVNEARLEFEQAINQDETMASAYVNLSTVYLVTGDRVRANELAIKACTLEADSSAAWAIRLQVDEQFDVNRVPDQLQGHPDIVVAIARTKLSQGETAAALHALHSVPPSERGPVHKLLLASAELGQFAPRHDALHEEVIARASVLLDEVFAELGSSEVPLRAEATWLRGAIFEWHGELDKAIAFYKQCANLRDLDPERACQVASIALESNLESELDTAGQQLTPAVNEQFPVSGQALMARVLHRRGLRYEARSSLEAAQREYEDARETSTNAVVALGQAALELGIQDAGQALLLPRAQEDVRIAVLCARLAKLREDSDAASAAYRLAIANSQGKQNTEIRIECAAYFSSQGADAEALELTRGLDLQDARVAQLRAKAHYNTGDLIEANAIVANYADRPQTWPASIGYYISRRRQDWASARMWLEKWRVREPALLAPILYLAEIQLRTGEVDDAAQLLLSASYEDASLHDRMGYSQLLFMAGRNPEALEVAYANLRDGYDEPELQNAYLVISVESRSERPLTPEVAIGTSVFLRSENDDEMAYLLVDREPKVGFGEVALDTPLGKKLLGKRVGDTVVFREPPYGRSAIVTDIGDKHTYALRWSFRRLEKADPVSPKVRSVHFPKTQDDRIDFSELFENLRHDAEREAEVLSYVQDHLVPLAVAAKALGLTVPQLYPRMINNQSLRILIEESDVAPAVGVAQERRCVLTRSALFTIRNLGALDLLESFFDDIVLHPLLVGELRSELGDYRRTAERGSAGIVLQDGQPLFHEVTAEQGQALLGGFQEFVEKVLEIGREVALPLDHEKYNADVWQYMPPWALSASLVAREQSIPLLVDDLVLRRYAAQSLGARGFSCYALFHAALEAGELDIARFRDFEATLLVAGYEAVPLTPTGLNKVMNSPGWPPITIDRVLRRFPVNHADLFSLINAAKVAVYILKNGAINRYEEDIGALAHHVFSTLFSDASVVHLRRFLEVLVGRDLALLPRQQERVQAVWHGFLSDRRVEAGG